MPYLAVFLGTVHQGTPSPHTCWTMNICGLAFAEWSPHHLRCRARLWDTPRPRGVILLAKGNTPGCPCSPTPQTPSIPAGGGPGVPNSRPLPISRICTGLVSRRMFPCRSAQTRNPSLTPLGSSVFHSWNTYRSAYLSLGARAETRPSVLPKAARRVRAGLTQEQQQHAGIKGTK